MLWLQAFGLADQFLPAPKTHLNSMSSFPVLPSRNVQLARAQILHQCRQLLISCVTRSFVSCRSPADWPLCCGRIVGNTPLQEEICKGEISTY